MADPTGDIVPTGSGWLGPDPCALASLWLLCQDDERSRTSAPSIPKEPGCYPRLQLDPHRHWEVTQGAHGRGHPHSTSGCWSSPGARAALALGPDSEDSPYGFPREQERKAGSERASHTSLQCRGQSWPLGGAEVSLVPIMSEERKKVTADSDIPQTGLLLWALLSLQPQMCSQGLM